MLREKRSGWRESNPHTLSDPGFSYHYGFHHLLKLAVTEEYGLYRQEYCGCLYSKPVDNAAAVE